MAILNPTPVTHYARLTDRLRSYWDGLRGDRPFPREDEIDPDALKEVWDHCFLVDVRDRRTFAYSYLGNALIEAYGDDITGKEISETLIYPHPVALFRAFHDVTTNAHPGMDAGEFTNAHGLLVKYRSCVLPLGSLTIDGVTYLLGGMRWKV